MIEGLNLEVWGQRARRVKAVVVTDENRNAVLLWLGFTQDEIDNALGGIAAVIEPGDAIVLTNGGSFVEVGGMVDEDGTTVDVVRPKPGQFTRVCAEAIDYLYRRPSVHPDVLDGDGGVRREVWYGGLDAANANDEDLDAWRAAEIADGET